MNLVVAGANRSTIALERKQGEASRKGGVEENNPVVVEQ